MACSPSEDSDQPGHPSSLIEVFAVCMKKAWVPSYPLSTQRRRWSDWTDAQADLSLRGAHMPFCWFCHEAAPILLISTRLTSLSELALQSPREDSDQHGRHNVFTGGNMQSCEAGRMPSSANITVLHNMSHVTRKPVFGNLPQGKTQTGLLSF